MVKCEAADLGIPRFDPCIPPHRPVEQDAQRHPERPRYLGAQHRLRHIRDQKHEWAHDYRRKPDGPRPQVIERADKLRAISEIYPRLLERLTDGSLEKRLISGLLPTTRKRNMPAPGIAFVFGPLDE